MESSEPFRRVKIDPQDCLSRGWELIAPQYWLFVGICAVGQLLSQLVPLGLLQGPMWCGIFLCCAARMEGREVRFEKLFEGFDYFLPSFLVTLLLMAVSTAIVLPTVLALVVGMLGVAGAAGEEAGGLVAVALFGGWTVAFLIVFALSLLLWTFFFFAYPLVADRRLGPIDAIRTSGRAAAAHLGGVLGLVVLSGVILLLAALFCYLPVFLVAPICFAAWAVAYRKVFPGAEAVSES